MSPPHGLDGGADVLNRARLASLMSERGHGRSNARTPATVTVFTCFGVPLRIECTGYRLLLSVAWCIGLLLQACSGAACPPDLYPAEPPEIRGRNLLGARISRPTGDTWQRNGRRSGRGASMRW